MVGFKEVESGLVVAGTVDGSSPSAEAVSVNRMAMIPLVKLEMIFQTRLIMGVHESFDS